MSRTGSGKTAAFVVPMLQKLKAHDTKGIRAVIIEPIRELAIQTHKVVREVSYVIKTIFFHLSDSSLLWHILHIFSLHVLRISNAHV